MPGVWRAPWELEVELVLEQRDLVVENGTSRFDHAHDAVHPLAVLRREVVYLELQPRGVPVSLGPAVLHVTVPAPRVKACATVMAAPPRSALRRRTPRRSSR